jgi:hypothetical protein
MDQLHASIRGVSALAAAVPTARLVFHRGFSAVQEVRQSVIARANLQQLAHYKEKTVRLGCSVARMTRQLSARSLKVGQ